VFGAAVGTTAKNGDPVRVGEKTSATRTTTLESRKGPALQARLAGGAGVGIKGSASSSKGIGVQGEATSEKGASVGIQGLSESPEGVAGQFIARGGGRAIEAEASDKNGVALRTKGRLELTEVHARPVGDVRLAGFDPGEWREVVREHHGADARHAHAFSFVTLVRR